jgi:serine/threonine protein phosphatase PrpC
MTLNSFEDNLINWFLRKTAATAVRRVADLPAVLASSIGLVRDENQDRVAAFRFADFSGCEFLLIVLCDGMGGMVDGAKCAATTIASFSAAVIANINRFNAERTLSDAASTANERVYDLYRGVGGATLSAILMVPKGEHHYWVSLGDSRIYALRENSLVQLTVDDTLAGQLADKQGSYTGRNELLQFVGMGEAVEPHVGIIDAKSPDAAYLITSDGVHFLRSNILQDILQHAPEHAVSARRLIDLAMWCGGHDNASLAITFFSGDSMDVLPSLQLDAIEVWDAFGDARFFGVSRYYHRRKVQQHDIRTELASAPDFMHNNDVAVNQLSDELSGSNSINAKPRLEDSPVLQTTKRKKPTKKKIGASEEREKKIDLVPQLTINFRKKD